MGVAGDSSACGTASPRDAVLRVDRYNGVSLRGRRFLFALA
jgi:hypothetical protein